MPWIVPSHQAPVLRLARSRPAWFSGLGLVLGTMAPDLAFILPLDASGAPASHTLAGQLYITLPLVLVLHALLTWLVLPWLLPHLPGGAPLHLHELARSRPATGLAANVRVAASGLLGGLTHIFIDGFTHGDHSGWAVALLPWLATPVPYLGGEAPLYDALQLWLTLGLGVLAMREWGALVRGLPQPLAARPERVRPAPPAARRTVQLGLFAAALAGAGFGPVLKGALGTPDALKLAAYGSLTFCALASLIGAFADRARLVLNRVRLDVGPGFGLGSDPIRGASWS
jgi:hypothetical protein